MKCWVFSLILFGLFFPVVPQAKEWRSGMKTGMSSAKITSDVGLEKINGFKGTFIHEGWTLPFRYIDENRVLEIMMNYQLSYKFWVLVGEPIFDMSFNHQIHSVRVISKGSDVTLNRELIPSEIFDKIQVRDFYVELIHTDYSNVGTYNHVDTTFYRPYPGVISRQGKVSFDVPSSPSWDKLFRSSSTDSVHPEDAEFVSKKEAKSIWLRFVKAKGNKGNFTQCYLRQVKVNISPAMAWLQTNNKPLYKQMVAGRKNDRVVSSFINKIESNTLPLKEKMAAADQAIEYLNSINASENQIEEIREAVQGKVVDKIEPALNKALALAFENGSDEELDQAIAVIELYEKKYGQYYPEALRDYASLLFSDRFVYVYLTHQVNEVRDHYYSPNPLVLYSSSMTKKQIRASQRRREREEDERRERWEDRVRSDRYDIARGKEKYNFTTEEFKILLPPEMTPEQYKNSAEVKSWMQHVCSDVDLPSLDAHSWNATTNLHISKEPSTTRPTDNLKNVTEPPTLKSPDSF